MRLAAILTLVGGMAAIAAGCHSTEAVDGYELAGPAPCAPICDRYVSEARSWLDREAPGHPPIQTADVRASRNLLYVRSGSIGDYVVVLHLEGGSERAIMIGCGIGLDRNRCETLPAVANP
jgi:hypothetical protein